MLSPYDARDHNPMGSSSTIPLPMMASTESLRVNSFERNTGLWYLLKHNWRQLTSLVPGVLLLCATGNLHISWTLWQIFRSVFHHQEVQSGVLLAWFVGAMAGILAATFVNQAWSKICIYYSVAVSLLPVSLMFVLYQTTAYNVLLVGRALAGILYGITLMTFVLHIADNSSQLMRRYFVWTIPIVSALPTVLFAETLSSVTSVYDLVATIGVLMFVLAIFTLIFMPCTYESIIFLLESGNDLRALEIMLKLRNESRHFIRRDFNEFKMMLAEDISETGTFLSTGNYRPLFSVLLLRILNALMACNSIYWIFLANVMLDFRHWTLFGAASMQIGNGTAAGDVANMSDGDTENQTEYSLGTTTWFDDSFLLDVPNVTDTADFANSTTEMATEMTTEAMADAIDATDVTILLEAFTEPEPSSGMALLNGTLWADEASPIVDDLANFADQSGTYALSMAQLTQFVLVVCAAKLVVGIVAMCVAEKFQIYRNRILLKATLAIGLINAVFFLLTLICYRFDDNLLLFTFYMGKLANLIYGGYLLIAFAIDTIGYCELAESFSLAARYRYMAAILICEHLIYAYAILLIMNALYSFGLLAVQSMLVSVICVCLLRCMPNDCLDRSLRGARDKYFAKMATANA